MRPCCNCHGDVPTVSVTDNEDVLDGDYCHECMIKLGINDEGGAAMTLPIRENVEAGFSQLPMRGVEAKREVDYVVIHSDHVRTLEECVTMKLKEGYRLHGAMVLVGASLMQAMVKDEVTWVQCEEHHEHHDHLSHEGYGDDGQNKPVTP